jgi:hypothetical protein
MKKIFKLEGGLIPEYISENIKIFTLCNFYGNEDYLNYDNTYISLTRQSYADCELQFFPQSFRPAQFAGAIQFGYDLLVDNIVERRTDIQITGHSIPENVKYQTDCLNRGRAINNFNERSDYTTFNLPRYSISGATKIVTGTTSASTGVYIVDTVGSGLTLTAIFNAYVGSFFSNEINGIKFELYYRLSPTTIIVGSPNDPFLLTGFVNSPVFHPNRTETTDYFVRNNLITYKYIAGYSATTFHYDINNLEGEFIIKGYFRWTNMTYFASLLGNIHYDNPILLGQPYGIYNDDYDYYFIYLKKADKPLISSSQIITDTVDLNVLTIKPSYDGQIYYLLPNKPVSKPIVTVNGVTLSNFEYTITGQTMIISGGTLLTTDYVNIIYSRTPGSQTIQTESYKITSIPSIGYPIYGDKVIYNTGTTKYEFWLDVKSRGDVILTVNGQTLSKNIDYYVSSSDSRRIIIENTLIVGDIINAFYNSVIGDNQISNRSYQISWKIPPPKNNMGFFTVEVANYGDIAFSTPIFSGITLYTVNEDNYFTNVEFTGSYGTKYIYRVKNQKNYYTVLGELIHSVNYSDVIPLTINTNSLNNY